MVAKKPLVSVLMSTYNETQDELQKSVSSILNQTYKKIEFIIIDDNPANIKLKEFLQSLSDERIKVIYNANNIGLVASLNRALEEAQGEYIARMDADDISNPTRIEDELDYLICHDLDLIGSYVTLIDESGNTIKTVMKFPEYHKRICKFMKWGCSMLHPSWLGNRQMFEDLKGYRKAPHCEDYDFLLRAIKAGYHLGNIPKVELLYRIRPDGVSRANRIDQYLMRYHLSDLRRQIDQVSEDNIDEFLHSETYAEQKRSMENYYQAKADFKSAVLGKKLLYLVKMGCNWYFWKDIKEKITLYLRER